jgi:hypothetical protein
VDSLLDAHEARLKRTFRRKIHGSLITLVFETLDRGILGADMTQCLRLTGATTLPICKDIVKVIAVDVR